MNDHCAARTANGKPCSRSLGTPNSSAQYCGLHELGRRREQEGNYRKRNPNGPVYWRGKVPA